MCVHAHKILLLVSSHIIYFMCDAAARVAFSSVFVFFVLNQVAVKCGMRGGSRENTTHARTDAFFTVKRLTGHESRNLSVFDIPWDGLSLPRGSKR